MPFFRKLWACLLSILVLCVAVCPANAHDVPQADIPGSIEMTVRYDGKTVGGGSMTCIKVGEVYESDGNYAFRRVLDGKELTDIQSAEYAKDLAAFAKDNSLSGQTRTIGEDGKASFENLEIGLYLLVQDTPAAGYSKLQPFLVSVPYWDGEAYIYDIDAQVKGELERVPQTQPPTAPTAPTDPKLPQTGQLNWPIPLLVLLGLGLFAAGWALRFGREKDET